MRPLFWLLILSAFATLQGQTFQRVDYLYRATDEAEPEHRSGVLVFDQSQNMAIFVSPQDSERYGVFGKVHTHSAVRIEITSKTVVSAIYERAARPRYGAGLVLAWPLLFTKEKKHFLTLQYKTDSGDRKYAIFHLDKRNYQEALAATEATLGIKVERFEER